MLSLTRFGTRDVARAKPFYDAIASLLGATCVVDRPEVAGWRGADGGMFLIGKPLEGEASVGNGVQVGFNAASREVVDAVYAKAIALGGKCEGPPGVRGPDPNGIYAAYFRDLDGNKLSVFRFGG
jgi:hypothetical protein